MRHAKHQTAEELEDPSSSAELTVSTSPDGPSLSAKIPEKYAADLLPIVALVAVTAGPPATFYFAGTPPTLWWVVGIVAVLQVVAVITIVIFRRGRPRS